MIFLKKICIYMGVCCNNLLMYVQCFFFILIFTDLFCQYCEIPLDCNTEQLLCHTKECLKPLRPDKSFSYVCSFCFYRTHDSGRMRSHIRSHIGDKPFKCTDCNYSSSQKCHLIRHSAVHQLKKDT